MSYTPLIPPRDFEQWPEYILREFTQIKLVLDRVLQGEFEIHFKEPSRPIEGTLIFADGTTWNPGAGRGFYERRGGAWNKL